MGGSSWQSILCAVALCAATAQSQTSTPTAASSSQFTVPASAQWAPPVIPNIEDPLAVDAQEVCPGYVVSDFSQTASGLTAILSLAGKACNVYGTDIATLNLTVEYQAVDRLHVEIVPSHLDASNLTQYILPPSVVPKPTVQEANLSSSSDLAFSWTNKPSFGFTVTRKSTGDVLFSTEGKKLVFENQFIEFSSDLPTDYNLYGLGETIHSLRLGNNYTKTLYAADALDKVDRYVDSAFAGAFYLLKVRTGTSMGPIQSISRLGILLRVQMASFRQ